MIKTLDLKIIAAFAAFLLLSGFAGNAVAVEPSCADPNLTGIVSVNTSYSGEVFADQLVTINNGATLTLEAGTHVTMCGADAEFLVGNLGGKGGLVAIGTQQAPIVFDAFDPADKWKRLFFNSRLLANSILQYVILNDGGGNDPGAFNAPLYIGDASPNDEAAPVIDHVTINDSGAFGLVLLHNTGDATTASVSNISISGSAAAAITGDAGAMGGLSGKNQLLGNNPDRIIVGSGSNAQISIHSTWRNHGVPYELTGGVAVRTTTLCAWPCKWVLKPGVTLLVHPGEFVTVGSTSDATLEAIGTAEQPITISRLAANEDYWGQLTLNSITNHKLEHVNISWGGKTTNPRDTFGMIRQTGSGTVNMAHVRIENSQSSGYTIAGGDAFLRDVVVINNPRAGLHLMVGGQGLSVRSSRIINNVTGGVLNAVQSTFCVDAVGNYWGGAGGPAVSNDLASSCGNGVANIGLGDSASRGVLYRPWVDSIDGVSTNRSTIKASPSFVIADGLNIVEITVTLRDLSGNPLVGKTVELQSTVGIIQQPLLPSDNNGRITAFMTATEPGFATISATNLSDNEQVTGTGGVTFWQGSGATGGLINANGAPYAKPELTISSPPFIVGFPMEFSVSMQNTQSNPLDVEVIYGVSKLNIGVPFTPVYTAKRTLVPGEQWDAQGVYVPGATGHQCVQATLSFNDGSITIRSLNSPGSWVFQKNTNENPCADLDADNLVPNSGGIDGVSEHVARSTNEARKVSKCLDTQLNSGSSSKLLKSASVGAVSVYDRVYAPPVLTPPLVSVGGEITEGLAAAMNALAVLGGELSALITANGITRQRLQWAAQADDPPAVDLQYSTFRNYSLQQGRKLLEYASLIDVFLDEFALSDIADPLMTPDNQAAYLEMLKDTGFEQGTIDYIRDSGWGPEEVERRLQQTIAQYENNGFIGTTFADAMRVARDKAIADGNDLISRYGTVINNSVALKSGVTAIAAPSEDLIRLDPMSWEFDVGHDSLTAETVKLLVKPLNLPIDWSYELSDRELLLDPGENRKVTLRLFPGSDSISTDTINVAVEGYVLDRLIGGISFEYYVPNIIQPSDVIFTNGFE